MYNIKPSQSFILLKAGKKAKYQSEPKAAITSTLNFVYHNDDNFNN